MMTEFLHGIRVIKFYTWENYFSNKINDIRESELKQLRFKKYLDAFCVYFWACTPILMSVFTFSTYVLIGNQLTPSKVIKKIIRK
jgi:ATP-binding cassette subfamily C (CFTR/MRP) protein 10